MTDCTMKLKNALILAVISLLMACGSAKIEPTMEQDFAVSENPKIAFVTYKFNKDEKGNATISLINVLMAEGKLKHQADEKVYVSGDYELIQLDSQEKQLAFKKIGNPLNETIEYVNEDGEFGKKEVEFLSKEVSIRLQLHPQTKYILVQEIGNESTNYIKTKL